MPGFKKPEGDLQMSFEASDIISSPSLEEKEQGEGKTNNENSAKDIAMRVSNLSKCYEIYDRPHDRIKQWFYPPLHRLIGGNPHKKYYREFWALRNVSFEINKGETVGIIGLNGSGKSTLLKLISGILSPTKGTIETQGRIAALLELGSGFNPEFTGRENVYLNGAILGLSEKEIDSKFDDIVNFADIGQFINQPVKQYSSGMYVRLAFAVMANVDADMLVIDEALAVGDMLFTQKCMRFLRNFKNDGTVFFVSHNPGAVVNLCDRAVWLDRGEVQAIGPAKYVTERYLAKRYQASVKEEAFVKSDNSVVKGSHQEVPDESTDLSFRDMRMSFINHSNLRNDIRVFDFSADTRGFGNGGAHITNARLTDMDGQQLSWIVGGEFVRFVIEAKVLISCNNIIIGFNFKDRLGQVLFAQNTYISHCLKPVEAKTGEVVEAVFTFQMPILPRGTYAVDVAIASGTPTDAVQLEWLHDVFFLESQTSSIVSGLIGLIFDSIELRNKNTESE
jgi:lipopolysaccharide transport system ATP-binding protein